MSNLRQAAQQALEALGEATTYTSSPSWSPSMTNECNATITALRAALASAVAEPVAYSIGRTLHWHPGRGINDAQLYAAPPQRERCWACGNTGSVTTSSNGSGLIEVPCEDCAPKEQA